MSSFINLMGNDVWTATDIKNRLHAEIRSQISEQAETELNRALQGAIMKLHVMTTTEQQALMDFKHATDRVALLGYAARSDWLLLSKTLVHESAVIRLAQLLLEVVPIDTHSSDPNSDIPVTTEPALETLNEQERIAVQAIIDSATPDVLELAALRYEQNNPIMETPVVDLTV